MAPSARFRLIALATAALPVFAAALALLPEVVNAQSNSIVDRMRERAASRAETQTENEAGERVDSAVDKTVDCMFNPIECAKKTPAATTPAGGEAATAAADTSEWYAENQGQRVGPMPRTQLDSMVTGGQVTAQTLVWREGMSAWTPAGSVPELGESFKKVPPPLPPQKSGPPPLPAPAR
jgi:hypothetical protein